MDITILVQVKSIYKVLFTDMKSQSWITKWMEKIRNNHNNNIIKNENMLIPIQNGVRRQNKKIAKGRTTFLIVACRTS